MFSGCNFLIIRSTRPTQTPTLTQDADLQRLLLANNAANVLVKDDYDNSTNYMDPPVITHIITETIDFIEYNQAVNSMIPIATPNWVYDSINSQKAQNLRTYNPDPNYFLKDCFVCCADNLPQGDKELLYGAVKAFGGGYLDVVSIYTTHLIANDVCNDKAILASSVVSQNNNDDGVGGSSSSGIKVVVPHWIDHCITMGRKLDEANYLLPNPKILELEKDGPDFESGILSSALSESLPKDEFINTDLECFKGKKFFLSNDFNLSQRLLNSLKLLIERHGGHIEHEFDLENIDIYLGKYRDGEYYRQSSLNNRIIVGNLQWMYSILVSKKWTLPLNSNILYYPIPSDPIPDFQGLKISITNYSGEARGYLSKLIEYMGGTFTKALTRSNDYLVCAKAEGSKYDAAANKWLDSNRKPIVKVVNHLWLEDCFVKWELLHHDQAKYRNFGNGMEVSVGRIQLDPNVLKRWYETQDHGDMTGNVEDSMSEDGATQTRRMTANPLLMDLTPPPSDAMTNESQTSSNSPPANEVAPTTTESPDPVSQPSLKIETEDFPASSPPPPPQQQPKEESSASPPPADEVFVAPPPSHRYGGRSAAKKAAAKLHDNMTDLKAYQELTKSKTKMKDYMNQLEGTSTPTKRKHTEETTSETTTTPIKKPTQYKTIAMMTGCESEISLEDPDISKLQTLGVLILSEFTNNQTVNTLIAPKILRTAKFLRCLSTVDNIIHPQYLVDILKAEKVEDIKIEDYSLDKFHKNTNVELGYSKKDSENGLLKLLSSSNKGKLFTGLSLNLSTNLNGGVPVISQILKDHGMSNYKEIKNATNVSKNVIKNGEEKTILIANKTKDAKLIAGFKKAIKENGVVLEWDWCVKSIFKMELQNMDDFKL
ncbi:LOW QUALITY PROTEIN: brc1 BRCT-containing protein 1 [Candida maltosa Xu316]